MNDAEFRDAKRQRLAPLEAEGEQEVNNVEVPERDVDYDNEPRWRSAMDKEVEPLCAFDVF